jgi:hypothetical protein
MLNRARPVLALLLPLAVGLSGCVRAAPLAVVSSAMQPASCPQAAASGSLVVYSATYPQSAGQSEYPAHTRYTIFTANGPALTYVANNSGPFGAFPSRVDLPCGNYDVRAQYGSGRFVIIPITVEAGKLTLVDLSAATSATGVGPRNPIRLPDGQVIGWYATCEDGFRITCAGV